MAAKPQKGYDRCRDKEGRKSQTDDNQKKNVFVRLFGVKTFFNSIRTELKKVTWPDRKGLMTSAITVLAIIIMSSLIIFAFDRIINFVLTKSGFYTPAPTEPAAVVETIDEMDVLDGAVDVSDVEVDVADDVADADNVGTESSES